MTDLPQLARDLDYVKTNIGTTAQDHPGYYEAADRVLEYAGDQIANRIADGAPKPVPRTFAPGTIGADQPTEEQRKAWQAGATLGEVDAMGSAPAVTDEQRAAVKWLTQQADPKNNGHAPSPEMAQAILAALPSELTNPQPALPTEPGPYLSSHNVVVELRDGEWSMQGHRQSIEEVSEYAPLRPLVPERPQITREQIADHLAACSELPRLSNLDMADSILALVNGADQ